MKIVPIINPSTSQRRHNVLWKWALSAFSLSWKSWQVFHAKITHSETPNTDTIHAACIYSGGKVNGKQLEFFSLSHNICKNLSGFMKNKIYTIRAPIYFVSYFFFRPFFRSACARKLQITDIKHWAQHITVYTIIWRTIFYYFFSRFHFRTSKFWPLFHSWIKFEVSACDFTAEVLI